MSGAPRYRWMPFIAGAASIVTLIFGVFWLLETRLLGNADRETVATVHLVVGVGTSLLVLFYGLYFVLDRIEAAEAHADRAREGERRLFTFFERLPMAVFVLDHDGTPAFANRRAVEMLGRGVDPEAGPETLAEAYDAYLAGTDEPYPTDRMPIVRALEGEDDATADDMEIMREGRRIPLEIWANPIRDAEGRVTFAVAVFVDVSDRLRAEQEKLMRIAREKDLERVQEFDRLRSRFINMAAHELYTPITPIKLQVEALTRAAESGDTSRTQRSLEVIHRNVDRLHGVVHQILEVARIESGETGGRQEPLDLEAVVTGALEDFEATIRNRELRVERGLDADVLVEGDADRLRQAVVNLFDNVAKHTPKGTTMTVRCYARDGDAVVEVEDDGPGFDEAVADRLFQPFHQAQREAGDMMAQGWGLGLFVTRSVAQHHGGDAWCLSPGAGDGARAGFRVPLAKAKRREPKAKPS